MNDWELIQAYCGNGSENAFETLVKRHVDFVYCAALRQVRDPSLAEDVSQAVFLLLARKARSFGSGTVLVSWLFRATQFIAARALRTELRRQRRDIEAAQMNPSSTSPETDQQWDHVAPVLDEALATLPGKDRDAVLLRFFSRKPFSQVGREMGVSEDAAKKRVGRALGRLRQFFAQRGTTLSISAIVAILSERVVQAAPTALEPRITAAASAGASAASISATALLKATLHDLFWTKVKWGTAIGVGLMGALLLVSSALQPGNSETTISVAGASTTQGEPSFDVTRPEATDPGSNEIPAERKLSLLVMGVENRELVQGARVMVECFEGRNRQRILDSATDSRGGLDIPIPKAFDQLLVWVSAEGLVPIVMKWQGHELNEPVTSHTLVLEAGRAAAGTVLDESGNPISGATVSFYGPGIDLAKRENRHFHPELSASRTDANGYWATTQLPPQAPGESGVDIRVTHPDFVPMSPGVGGLPGFPTNAIIVLSNGVALSGRVVAADGSPVSNASIAKQSGTYLSTKTDAEGRFAWRHVEPGQVFVDVEAEGFETIHEFVWATNAANECAFTLKQPSQQIQPTAASGTPRTRLRGSVVDAETGAPIPRFKVLLGDSHPWPRSKEETVLTSPRLLGEGRDGYFDWQNLPRGGGFRLQVEAEGYLESVSEERSFETADREFEFKLRKATVLLGSVLTPDGLPADGAVVSLAGRGFGPVMQSPGRLLEPNTGFETTRTRTDGQGRFSLKLKTGARGVAVVHESGSALLTFAAATNLPAILQPWGAIEGALVINGQPAPNQTVSVTGCQQVEANPSLLFSFSYRTTTDEHGRFRFDQVLAGEHFVARQVSFGGGGPAIANYGHAALVKVESGAAAAVELRRQGRPVIGHLVFDGSPDDVHWGMSEAFLQVEGIKPPQLDYDRAPAASVQASLVHRAQTKFPFSLSKDGAIRADDVPPGTYTLSVQLESANISPQVISKPPFGSLKKQVVVPSVEDQTVPMDLGELIVERSKP